jgi:hypothetical protein
MNKLGLLLSSLIYCRWWWWRFWWLFESFSTIFNIFTHRNIKRNISKFMELIFTFYPVLIVIYWLKFKKFVRQNEGFMIKIKRSCRCSCNPKGSIPNKSRILNIEFFCNSRFFIITLLHKFGKFTGISIQHFQILSHLVSIHFI